MLQHSKHAFVRLHQPASHPIGFLCVCVRPTESLSTRQHKRFGTQSVLDVRYRQCSELFLLRGSHAAKTYWQGSSYSLRALECHSHAGLGAVGISRLASVGLLHVSRSYHCRLAGWLPCCIHNNQCFTEIAIPLSIQIYDRCGRGRVKLEWK